MEVKLVGCKQLKVSDLKKGQVGKLSINGYYVMSVGTGQLMFLSDLNISSIDTFKTYDISSIYSAGPIELREV